MSVRKTLLLVGLCAVVLFPPMTARGDELDNLLPIGKAIENFSLKDYRGKVVSLSDLSDSKLVVIAMLGTECPLAKLYTARLVELDKIYSSKGVAFLGLNSNVQDSITEISAHARVHQVTFPVLKDLGNRVADAIGAVRTPEVFVLDEKRVVRYWGRIDDQYGIGYLRDEARRHDLRVALDELLAGKDVTVPVAEAAGCFIGRIQLPDEKSPVIFSEHIAPILHKRCVECHRSGEIAPFSLTSYDEVIGWAETIDEVVRDNRMPPWHASPEHGEFLDDRRLSESEKQLIYDWVKAGAPQGDPKEMPPLPEFTAGWQLPQLPDKIVYMSAKPFAVPAEGTVRYQYLTVNSGFEDDKWVKAMEVRPGNRAVVHHVLVLVKQKGASAGGGEGFLAAYVPGVQAKPYPKGMAKRIPAGAQLTFQLHYTPVGTAQEDRSMIGFVFAEPDEVEHVVMTSSAVTNRIAIPPRANNHCIEATSGSVDVDVQLLSMMPHMHLRGKSFRYEMIAADSSRATLLDVPSYDFNWQTSYRLAQPIVLPAKTRMHCTAHYDNSSANLANPNPDAQVRYGEQTWDEMLFGYFDYAVTIDDYRRHFKHEESPQKTENGFAERVLAKYDKNGDRKISRAETPEGLRRIFDRLNKNGDDELTADELTEE